MAVPLASLPREKVKRILVIKPSSIGDVVHTLPVVSALRRGFPDSFIAWMVEEEAADIVRGNPYLDEILLSGRKRWLRELKQNLPSLSTCREVWGFLRTLRARQFDLVIDLQGLLKSAVPGLLSGASFRLGYSKAREMSHILLTHRVLVDDGKMHSVDRYLAILPYLGIPVPAQEREFWISISERDEAAASRLLDGHGGSPGQIWIALNAPARWQSKRWPKERFAELGNRLVRHLRAHIVLTGSKGDRVEAEEIASLMGCNVTVAAGETSLKQLCGILKRVDLMVTCDSGPMHIAAAMGTPTVALFGPTDPKRTGPYGTGHKVLQGRMNCIPCFKRKCPENLCMKEITVEEVLAAAEGILTAGLLRSAHPDDDSKGGEA